MTSEQLDALENAVKTWDMRGDYTRAILLTIAQARQGLEPRETREQLERVTFDAAKFSQENKRLTAELEALQRRNALLLIEQAYEERVRGDMKTTEMLLLGQLEALRRDKERLDLLSVLAKHTSVTIQFSFNGYVDIQLGSGQCYSNFTFLRPAIDSKKKRCSHYWLSAFRLVMCWNQKPNKKGEKV